MAPPTDLGSHVRAILTSRYGSMAVAAERLEISYERLKKAVQRNRFSARDLEILLPGMSVEDLKNKYEFNFARRGELAGSAVASDFDLFSTIESGFRSFQRGVRDIDFSHFVNDLYDKIGVGLAVQAMVLFCDGTTPPLEWSAEQVPLMKKLAHALDQGAIIIYVMETDLVGSLRSTDIEQDIVDKQFDRYLDRLDMWRDESGEDGFLALVRVRQCPFCTPFQKQTLFSCVASDESEPNRHHALTTIDVPEQSNGSGHLGTAALPQDERVAHAMRDYLIDLMLILRRGEPAKADFHFTASNKRGQRADFAMLREKLDLVARYQ